MIPDLFIGIDPGLTGAVAAIIGSDWVRVWDMPRELANKNILGKHRVSASAFNELVRSIISYKDAGFGMVFAAIESPQPVPKAGVAGVASFYKGIGICEGVLTALDIRFLGVRPQDWKRKLFFNSGIEPSKSGARKLVSQIYPNAIMQLGDRADEGRAEAILIARYAQLFS